DLPVFTTGDFQVAFVLAGRLRRNDVHQAAGSISPEQRALRPPEDLDAFHVEEIEPDPGEVAVVGLVYVHRDRRFLVVREIELAGAPYRERRRATRHVRDQKARYLVVDLRRAGHAKVFQLAAGKRGHGDPHVG